PASRRSGRDPRPPPPGTTESQRRARAQGRKRRGRVASMDAAVSTLPLRLALVGVPNCGKTALFNRLTGSRQKVANYPGVTVERKEGRFVGPRSGRAYRLVHLPGAYTPDPTSLDEAIARDVVLGRHASEPPPDLLVCVVDAPTLRLNLRLWTHR